MSQLQEESEKLQRDLVSKDDELLAMRSVMEDNSTYVKTVESKQEELKAELQVSFRTFKRIS